MDCLICEIVKHLSTWSCPSLVCEAQTRCACPRRHLLYKTRESARGGDWLGQWRRWHLSTSLFDCDCVRGSIKTYALAQAPPDEILTHTNWKWMYMWPLRLQSKTPLYLDTELTHSKRKTLKEKILVCERRHQNIKPGLTTVYRHLLCLLTGMLMLWKQSSNRIQDQGSRNCCLNTIQIKCYIT